MKKTTERNIMKKLPSVFLVLGLTGILSIGGLSPAVAQAKSSKPKKTFTVDVACDASTIALNRDDDPTTIPFIRADLAVVNGNIYPDGTLEQEWAPGFPPLGAIGTWRCLFVALAEGHLGGAVTYYFAIGPFADEADEDGLILVQGLNDHQDPDSVPRVHAVVGGTGIYSGATGQVLEEVIRQNDTGCFDLRFHFSLKKKPK